MGIFYEVTCRNKNCGYKTEIREGPGMRLFAWVKTLEEEILEGKEDAPEDIKDLLKDGWGLNCVTNFLCPSCQEWQTKDAPYIFEPIHISPYGTIREYKMHYLYGKPKCEKCGNELIHILNPRSSKNKCPKCGENNMRPSRNWGHYD